MNATSKRVVIFFWTILWAVVTLHSPSAAQTSRGADVAVVVNSDTPIADLSLSEVRKVLLGERQYWNSKLPVVFLIRAPAARERGVVLRVVYRRAEAQVNQEWGGKIFRGEAEAPLRIGY